MHFTQTAVLLVVPGVLFPFPGFWWVSTSRNTDEGHYCKPAIKGPGNLWLLMFCNVCGCLCSLRWFLLKAETKTWWWWNWPRSSPDLVLVSCLLCYLWTSRSVCAAWLPDWAQPFTTCNNQCAEWNELPVEQKWSGYLLFYWSSLQFHFVSFTSKTFKSL